MFKIEPERPVTGEVAEWFSVLPGDLERSATDPQPETNEAASAASLEPRNDEDAVDRGFDVLDSNGTVLSSQSTLQDAIDAADALGGVRIVASIVADGDFTLAQRRLTIIDEDILVTGTFTLENSARKFTLKGGEDITIEGSDRNNSIVLEGTEGTVKAKLIGGSLNSFVLDSDAKARVTGADVSIGEDVIITGSGNDRINARDGFDTISAGAGRNKVIGGEGNDTMGGLFGRDTFVFREGDDKDQIFDFETRRDKIRLEDFFGINAFSDVLDAARETKKAVILDFRGGDSIKLFDLGLDDLSANNFVIV